MLSVRFIVPFVWTAIFLALHAEARKSAKVKAYNSFKAYKPATIQQVCGVILIATEPKVTVTNTQIITSTPPASIVGVATTTTVTPATSTITSTITDAGPTVVLTPTSTTTITVTSLSPSSSPVRVQKRSFSKKNRDIAHNLLLAFDSWLLREICIDLLYQGNAARAPTLTVSASATSTFVQKASTLTKTQTNTVTAAAPLTTVTTHVLSTAVTLTGTSTSTVTATSTDVIYLSLPTDSASYCTSQGSGCTCTLSPAPAVAVTCTYTQVGQPAYFVSPPCTGTLAAQMQGGAGGGADIPGSFVSSSGVGSSGTSSAITSFAPRSHFTIRVGGDGGASSSTFGTGGYNGGGDGGCSISYGFCASGGGGATDLAYNGQVILAAGGAGGDSPEGDLSQNPDPDRVSGSPAPQGGSAVSPASGGGGGGGYPGGVNGYYDQQAGWGGISLLSNSRDTSQIPGSVGGASASLTFTCTGV